MNRQAMAAIFKRDLRAFFGNPTGYVFIVLFVVATGWLAYRNEFFPANKANVDLLSEWFPLLVVLLAPAITMAAWATEYRQGTDQLLLTLPAQDPEVVLAKFGACFGIYSIALGFNLLTNLLVLSYLGSPDIGLLVATYLGYWLIGGAFVAVGMLASSLTSNQTVAFVLGVIFCGLLFLVDWVVPVVQASSTGLAEVVLQLSPVERFESFTRGVVALEDLLYFVGLAAAALFANAVVLSRRHWTSASGHGGHSLVRTGSVVVGVLSLVLLLQQGALRADVTRERMLSLTPEARKVLDGLDEARPVTVEAWVSPHVPPEYVATRDALLRMLRELDAHGGDAVRVLVHDTELFSEEAERAETLFKIKPEKVATTSAGRRSEESLFMGLAFRCGARELTIPFFHRDLPIQYELTRAIGSVANVTRKKVGVTTGGLNIFGGFDFNTMNRTPKWQVLDDLAAQYEMVEVGGTAAIDTSLDVLLVPLPTALPQEHMDRVAQFLHQGGKALFLVDSFPYADMDKAPMREPGAGRNPFQQPRGPEPQRGDLTGLFTAIGVSFPKERVVWDGHNPHPEFEFPKEVVILTGASEGRPSAFNEEDPITSGLQEVLLLFPGELEVRETPDIKATKLLKTGPVSGWHRWDEHFQDHAFFGLQPMPPDSRAYEPKEEPRTLAVRLQGKMRAPVDLDEMKKGELGQEFQAIVVADLDLVSDGFYQLRRDRSGDKRLPELDNVTFIANCIDALAGEDAYLKLRKLRPKHRTLTRLEAREAEMQRTKTEAVKKAKEQSKKQLEEAQKRLDDAVAAIDKMGLDRQAREVMERTVQAREQRRLDAEKRRIEDAEKDAIRKAEVDNNRLRRRLEGGIQAAVRFIPPLPVLGLAVFVFWRKRQREREGTPAQRRRVA